MSSLKRYFIALGLVACSSWHTELEALTLEVGFVRNPSLEVFKETVIHFTPDAPHRFDQVDVHALDNGSGWCPGDMVEPLVLNLSDHLTPGDHGVHVQIDDVRPKDDDGHFGYWRVSAYLVGYR